MSKYVVFTFDDARSEVFKFAVPILNEYGMVSTVFVTTGYVDGTLLNDKPFYKSSSGGMSVDNLQALYSQGFEIAAHGDQHTNNIDDIENSIHKLKKWEVCGNKIGFSSPYSIIQKDNIKEYEVIKSMGVEYIRTCLRVKDKPLWFVLLWMMQGITHNKYLFSALNRSNIFRQCNAEHLYPSISIRNTTKPSEIIPFLQHLEENECAVLTFHSVTNDERLLSDTWAYNVKHFKAICKFVAEKEEIEAITLFELNKRLNERRG